LIKELVLNGMFADQARDIVDRCKPIEYMDGRWNHSFIDYPDLIRTLLWIAVKPIALEYIDEKCPQAWFRPMFTDDPIPKAI